MPGDRMELMPMSPRQSPSQLGNAAIQWACSRRGRVVLISVVLFVMLVGFTGARHQEAISNKYHSIASNYGLPSWRPYLPNTPNIVHTPFNAPSNTTLQLENGELENVPSKLRKTTPNFHLIMSSLDDSPEFCKTTLSGMLLHYPPPTVINLYQSFSSVTEKEKEQMKSTLEYLLNDKLVRDEDLLLIVDGQDTWFQLPSDVIIQQYKNVVDNANQRLLKQYGRHADGVQKYNQTIIFGATKVCEEFDMGCKYVPPSTLPDNIYGKETGRKSELMPAKFLDSKMMIGPAKDLKMLFKAAVLKFESKHSQSETIHSVFSAIFGEQQLARDEAMGNKEGRKADSKGAKVLDWFGGAPVRREEKAEGRQYEFSIGLDYTHTIFQPFVLNAPNETVALVHDNSTDLSVFHHDGTPAPAFLLPTALEHSAPPFWIPDLSRHNPSPNTRPAHIENLKVNKKLDKMKSRSTSWAELKLVTNTYTGVVPAILHTKRPAAAGTSKLRRRRAAKRPMKAKPNPDTNISWKSLWFVPYSRALLRSFFRTPQSPIGYHDSLVGGDRLWDQRGGRGGVWTEKESIWLPWGEVDGVCGTLKQLKEIFRDGKGVWLHENEQDNEQKRLEAEQELKDRIAEEERKQREHEEEIRKSEEEKQRKEEEEKAKKEEEEKAKKAKEEQDKEDAAREKQEQEKAEHEEQQAEELKEKLKSEGDGEEEGEAEEKLLVDTEEPPSSRKVRLLRRKWIA